jgi:hypothetical protein
MKDKDVQTVEPDIDLQKTIEQLLKELPQRNYPVTTSFSRDIMLKLLKCTKDTGAGKVQDVIRIVTSAGLKKLGY